MKLNDNMVVLDTETVGLDWEKHDVWEIAYAIGEGDVNSYVVPHSTVNADLKALELNGYNTRGGPIWYNGIDLEIRAALVGKTLIGANPSFDAYRLEKRWGIAPWHYRLVDVESMAIPILDLDKPLGLKGLVDTLGDMGYTVPENDHTAEGDVLATREVYRVLRDIGRRVRSI